ncbi:MDR family MFS transporter [Bradyrhizobium sp. LHD-71]|uniref:MDR family MFS transporter n=1 Tax=Bradyrhizobium sp. LHD-71 TaxID=3072141 RepID=UPI00280CF356|nr:MDR family MFS transporter [Bradyrhizobium sp. LHD-71]MDQ8728569.1 MDR family MFS transporter [Bradyrhizobium sp. LHD-71]
MKPMDNLARQGRDADRGGADGAAREGERSALTPADLRPLLAGLMVAMFLAALDQTIVAIALPTIGRQFNDMGNLSWIVTAYLLSGTAVAPVFGTLSDIFGRRIMIVIALSIFVAASVLCALAPNMLTLILARFLQGIGGGGIIPVVQTIIADAISPKERGEYQAYFSGVWLAAGLSGPLLGGIITEYLHWSAIFWINLPLTALALAALLPHMHRLPVNHRRRKVDWLGGALLMTSAIVILLILTWGGVRYAWSSPVIVAMGVGALMLLGAFVWYAERTAEPFLPLRLLGGSVVPFAILAGGLTVGCLLGLTVYLPMFYEVVYKLSASEAGLALLPLVALSVPGSWVAGRVMLRRHRYLWISIAGASLAAVCFGALALADQMSLWLFLVVLSVGSLGVGPMFSTTMATMQNAVARSQIGTATGAMNYARALMSSFAVAGFTAILMAALSAGGAGRENLDLARELSGADAMSAFRYIFATAGLMMAGAALSMALMEERPLAGPERDQAEPG